MDLNDLLVVLKSLIEDCDSERFVAINSEIHPADIAAAMAEMSDSDAHALLMLAEPKARASLYGYLQPEDQVRVAGRLSRNELAELFALMEPDDRADLYNRLPAESREDFMPALAQAERENIRQLAAYEEKTVGSVMTSEYATVPANLNAREAVAHLSRIAPDAETIYQAFVVDGQRKLLGTVSLRELIVASPQAAVDDLMRYEAVSVQAQAPREESVRLIAKYDLLALPVVDSDNHLVGIVTYDDAMDVEKAETDIDFEKVGGVGEVTGGIRNATVSLLYKRRVFWLLVLVFGNIFTGAGIAFFEETIEAHVALVFFLPLLIDSGGNAGSQSATLMVRALATGEVKMKDWSKMLGRELVVAGFLGATMALAVSSLGIWRGGPEIALVVALTMQLIVIVGSLIGMSLPFLLSKLRFDPATASAPLITSIADAAGVLIYFTMATMILQMPTV